MSIYGDVITLENMIDNCFDLETGEIRQEDDTAYQELLKELSEDGLERLAKVLTNKTAFVLGVDNELKRLKRAKLREEKQIDWIKSYMLAIWEKSPKDKNGKILAGTFTIGARKSTSVVVEENFNNPDFQTTVETIKVDKVSLKNALVQGLQIEGAYLVQNMNLTIL